MVGALFLLLLAVPVIELWIIIQVSGELGLGVTLILLVLISVAGAWLLKQQGLQTWRRLQSTLSRGQMPTAEATDGALILLGGALLMTPGFLTDAFGILLLLPPARAVVKGITRRVLGWWATRRFGRSRWSGDSAGGAQASRARDRHPPVIDVTEAHRSSQTRRAEDDSRDKG
ncbi:MAG: FxsA family protein [Actinomycetota bacterium]|nr:FxsA family protein [Actinomycetota bacterium]